MAAETETGFWGADGFTFQDVGQVATTALDFVFGVRDLVKGDPRGGGSQQPTDVPQGFSGGTPYTPPPGSTLSDQPTGSPLSAVPTWLWVVGAGALAFALLK